jgi:uncharacterized protein (TIGR02453 family)
MKPTTPSFPAEGLKFLRSLKRNNRREWFQPRREQYEQLVRQPMAELVLALGRDLAKAAPQLVADPAVSLYRIYRDTRFTPDKTPYKTHSAAILPWRSLGKNNGAGLYFHVGAADVTIAGGLYTPERDQLLLVRQHIVDRYAAFRGILAAQSFKKRFGKLEGEQLSRVPRGFCSEHPAAELLKYKRWIGYRSYPAEFAATPGFYRALRDDFRALIPLVRFLNEPLLAAARRPKRSDFASDIGRVID